MIPLSFAADRTLGKLAKWLRIMGFDTIFESEVCGDRFPEDLNEDRIVLTRTVSLKKRLRVQRCIFISSNYLSEQLNQVIVEIGIRPADIRPFSICLDCNVAIVAVDKIDVYGLVPDYIFETHSEFHRCCQCHRIFWPGSHTQRSLERIEQLFSQSLTL